MQKTYFHDKKHHREKDVQKKIIPLYHVSHKRIVDINKLLNRVRMDKENETKKKIIFYSLTILALSLFLTFIGIIK